MVVASSSKVLAKVILITKDEHDLVGDFLEYYGTLFGRENVVVVDNGSREDSSVHAVYQRHVEAGGEVRLDARPFCDAVRFMSDHMRTLCDSCEFILPLETDEFLFLPDRDASYTPTREDVAQVLRAVPDDVSVIRYGSFLGSSVDPSEAGYANGAYSRPVLQMTRFHDQGWDKIIVRASAFETMTQWCHHAQCSSGSRLVNPGLGLLHFHQTGLRRQVERSVPVITAYGYVDVRAPLSEQLQAVAPLVDAPIACGHKLNYYARHLRRRAVLQSFRARIGRLPLSAAEMDEYAADVAPDEAVRGAILAGKLTVACPYATPVGPCWDDLLYQEPRTDGDLRCSQVRNFFLIATTGRREAGEEKDAKDAKDYKGWVDSVPAAAQAVLLIGRATEAVEAAGAVRCILPSAKIDWIDTSGNGTAAGTAGTAATGSDIRKARRLDPDCPDSLRLLGGYDVVVDARRGAGTSTRTRTMVNLAPLLMDRDMHGTYILLGCEAADEETARQMRKDGVQVAAFR